VRNLNPTRREVLAALACLSAVSIRAAATLTPAGGPQRNDHVAYGQDTLPLGIRSRSVDNNNGVKMHILEAGFEDRNRPCVVLLHGFPELAYTWRNQLLPLAAAGFHVMAPDLRGYGRSVTTPIKFDDDLLPYSLLNRVSDVLGLVRATGHERVAAVIGHDWGAPTAAWCALVRPDVFQSVVLMSTPFDGPPELPINSADRSNHLTGVDIQKDLAALPRPRKHYRRYLATRGANEDMWHAPQGVRDLLRAQFYFKSADWKGNRPFALKSWVATELAKLPEYYVMDLNKTVAETMAAHMPSKEQTAACKWMTEQDLNVYSTEYGRTGFQGGLNLYRIFDVAGDLNAFSGRTIDVPACYLAGASDWGVYQSPGAFEAMQHGACTRLLGVHLVNGAGHSLAEEQPRQVNALLLAFLQQANVLASLRRPNRFVRESRPSDHIPGSLHSPATCRSIPR
jgi:pimeloyl-ACP methyl ester carboxylesterase